MTTAITPPARAPKRALSRAVFDRTFSPFATKGLTQRHELPPNPNPAHWWTVTDLDPAGQRLYLRPGIRRSNALGFIQTLNAWSGEADAHPIYVY